LARPLGVKWLGPIWSFWPITSEDFKPLTQRIGLASMFKAALMLYEWEARSCTREPYIGCPYPCPCLPMPMGSGWAWMDIGRCWWLWSGYGYKFEGKCWAPVYSSNLSPVFWNLKTGVNTLRHWPEGKGPNCCFLDPIWQPFPSDPCGSRVARKGLPTHRHTLIAKPLFTWLLLQRKIRGYFTGFWIRSPVVLGHITSVVVRGGSASFIPTNWRLCG
jgi:hypothetical protein